MISFQIYLLLLWIVIIDSRSSLNGASLVFVVLFRALLHPFVILTGVNGGVCAAAPWSVLHRNEVRINMVTAFVGQTFEVGTCIFSALFITHVRVLRNSDLEIQLQQKEKKKKKTQTLCFSPVRWSGGKREMEICTNIAGGTSRHSQHLETVDSKHGHFPSKANTISLL